MAKPFQICFVLAIFLRNQLLGKLCCFWQQRYLAVGSIYKEKLVKISSFSKGPMKDRFRCVYQISGMTDSPFRSIRSLKPTRSQMLPDDSHNFIAKTFSQPASPTLFVQKNPNRSTICSWSQASVKFHSRNTMEG